MEQAATPREMIANLTNAISADGPDNDPAKRARKPDPIVEVFRDTLEARAFAFAESEDLKSVLTPSALEWLAKAQRAATVAPDDENAGGREAGRKRHYSIGTYARRAKRGTRFSPIAPYVDEAGNKFTTYVQPAGNNRDYSSERRFTPVPEDLLGHDGLQELMDFYFNLCPASLYTNEARDILKVGIHIINSNARDIRPGISSPNRAHVDGEYVTFVTLLERVGVIGGGNLVVERKFADTHPNEIPYESRYAELTLLKPFDTLAVDDRRVAHYVFPVYAAKNASGYRSVVLIDFTPLHPGTSDAKLESE